MLSYNFHESDQFFSSGLWIRAAEVMLQGETHPKQDSGVIPPLHQEGHVEMDKQERVDPQPHQLERTEPSNQKISHPPPQKNAKTGEEASSENNWNFRNYCFCFCEYYLFCMSNILNAYNRI